MNHLSRGTLVTFLASASVLALSACAAGHGLTGKPVDVSPALPEAPSTFVSHSIEDAPLLNNWLDQFEDPQLMTLVEEALAANPSIQASEATARAARQNARAVFGRSLPSVNYSFANGYSTTFTSQALGGGVVVDGRFDQPSFNNQFQFAWELDLWGRVQANNRAARADYIASEADLAGAQLSIGGQAAIAWINLKAAIQQLRIAEETYETNKSTVYLTERRFARGLSTALDVRTARTQLAASEAQIAAQTQTRNEAARQLEVLLGRYPSAEIQVSETLAALPPISAPMNPEALLTRRPDIAASEARLEAAGLRAEAARLAIFPAFNINSTISNSSSVEFADIFDPERISANIFGSLTQSVWQGGAIRADKRAALAQAESAAANYVDIVLTAWQEVENALDADRLLAEQEAAQLVALEEGRLAEDLATRQYQNGLVSIFNLLQAQTTRLNTESSVVQASAARAVNRINYHMALGGGILDPSEDTTQTSESDI